jgi:hypothetical protein
MTERLKQEGRLLENEEKERALELKIKGLINSIRDLLDPFEKLEVLKCDIAVEQTIELAQLQIDYKEVREEIAAIKRHLGR